MGAAILAILTSRAGIVALLGAGLLVLFGVQELRLKSAQHAQRAAQEALATCQGRVVAQNAAIALQARRGAAALVSNAEALKATRPRTQMYARAAEKVTAPAPGQQCQRWDAVDAEIVGAFR